MGSQQPLEAVLALLYYVLSKAEIVFYRIPGSVVITRYIKSSHQNDPGRTLLEVILVILVVRTLMHSRTRADRSSGNFVQLSEKVSPKHSPCLGLRLRGKR